MPVPDLESFKVSNGEVSSSTKFNNLVQAIEDEFADIDQDQITGLAYGAYTPTWASSGTQPALGNGTITGRFMQFSKFVHFGIDLTMGSTTTFGTGTYTLSLPVAANTSSPWSANNPIGQVFGFDSSGNVINMAMVILASSTTVNMQYPVAWPTSGQGVYQQTAPWTWAQSDFIRLTGRYEAS